MYLEKVMWKEINFDHYQMSDLEPKIWSETIKKLEYKKTVLPFTLELDVYHNTTQVKWAKLSQFRKLSYLSNMTRWAQLLLVEPNNFFTRIWLFAQATFWPLPQ